MDLLYSVASRQNREKERNEHKDDAGIGGVFATGTRGRHGAIFLRKSCFFAYGSSLVCGIITLKSRRELKR